MKNKNQLTEKAFDALCLANGIPAPSREVRFHSVRMWRFDYAWPDLRVALEIEGGIWTGGAHGRGTGIARDIEKYNYAGAMGWVVLRCTPSSLIKGETIGFVKAAMNCQRPKVESNPNPKEQP